MLTPYNYSGGTTKTATKTPIPTASTGGSLKPFKYATYTPPAPTPPPVAQPGFLDNVIGGAKSFGSDIWKSITAPVESSADTGSTGGDIAMTTINSYVNSLKDAGNRLQNLQTVTTDKKSTGLQKGIATGQALMGGLSTFFAPLTAAGAGAAQIPVLGHVAQGINNLFGAIGTGGADVGEGALQAIPGLSQETKDQLSPLVKEVFALGAQIAVGKGGSDVYKAFKTKTGELSHTIADKVSTELPAHPEVTGKPQGTLTPFDYSKVSDQKHADYAKSQGYEPYTPPDQLPTINAGTVPKGDLPTIQTESPVGARLGDLTLEPIKQVTPQLTTSYEKLVKATETGDSATAEATLKEIKTQVTVLAAKVEQNSAANTFQSKVFERMKAENPDVLEGDLNVKHMNLKEDATKAVDLVASDKQAAFETAMGQKASKDVTSTATNIALAEKALQEGNHDLYARLIKKRSLDQTRRGQEIVAERGSVTDNSTSRYVKELIASRLDKLGGEYLGDIKTKLTKVSAKQKATRAIDAEVKTLERKIKAKKLDTKTAVALLDKLTCV